jgi:MYXO-CTERM domain-containing protein
MRQAQSHAPNAAFALIAMAAATQTHAAIIYQNIPDVTLSVPALNQIVHAGIDFLGDGSVEFQLNLGNQFAGPAGYRISWDISTSTSQCRVLAGPQAGWAARYSLGDPIVAPGTAAPALLWQRYYDAPGPASGYWLDHPGTYFVGLVINGIVGPNYGWARITNTFDSGDPNPTLTLHDFAFEGTAFAPINAGQIPAPGAIALLGIGGLAGLRRRR